MKVLVCGGREYCHAKRVNDVLTELHEGPDGPITTIVNGAAPGADELSTEWADAMGVTVKDYPAKWRLHGRAAGPIRNEVMLNTEMPDKVVAFPGGWGTWDMTSKAQRAGVDVVEVAP